MNTIFLKVSEIKPDELMEYLITDVGEKSKEPIYNYLEDLSKSYPDFNEWYFGTVDKEIKSGKNGREIIIALSKMGESENRVMTGIAILKKTTSEQKICTFRIHQDYRSNGIGTELFEECFKFLGTRKPMITISENNMKIFKKHIDLFKFECTQELRNYYLDGITEYVFNGSLGEDE